MSLWDEAREQFLEGLRKDPKAQDTWKAFLQGQNTPQDAKAILGTIRTESDKKYGGAEASGGGRGLPKKWIDAIMSNIDNFIQLGGMAMTYAPETVKTGWWVVSQVLTGISNNYKLYDMFGATLGDITELMPLIINFDTLYHKPRQSDLTNEQLLNQLFGKIRDAYVAILDFGYSVRKHITAGKLGKAGHALKDLFGASKGEFDAKKATIVTLKNSITEHSHAVFQSSALGGLDGIQETASSILAMTASIKNNQQFMQDIWEEIKNRPFQDYANQEFEKIKKALSPIQETKGLEVQLKHRLGSSGSWLFEHSTYQEWMSSETGKVLSISGDEGSGKSMLLAILAQNLSDSFAKDENVFILCIAGQDVSQQGERLSSTQYQNSVLFWLYETAYGDDPLVLQRASGILQTSKGQKRQAPPVATKGDKDKGDKDKVDKDRFGNFAELFEKLAVALSKKKAFVIFDSIDQLEDPKSTELLDAFRDLCALEDVVVRVAVSCRQEGEIFKAVTQGADLHIDMHGNSDKDIGAVLDIKLKEIPGLTDAEFNEAKDMVMKRTGGIFSYLINVAIPFLQRPFPRPISTYLRQLPDDLHESYNRAWQRLGQNAQDLLKLAIKWALIADGDPLYVNEIMEMYTGIYFVKDNDPNNKDYDNDTTTVPLYLEQLEDIAGPFLTITPVKNQHVVKLKQPDAIRKFCKFDEDNVAEEKSQPQEDNLCPRCKKDHSASAHFVVSRKQAALELCLKFLLHLNSPSFQKKWRLDPPAASMSGNEPAAATSNTENGTKPTLENIEQPKLNRETNGEVHGEVNGEVQREVNGDGKVAANDDTDINPETEANTEQKEPEENGQDKSEAGSDESDSDDDEFSGAKGRQALKRQRSFDSEDRSSQWSEDAQSEADSVAFHERFDWNRYEIRYWAEDCRRVEELLTEQEKAENPDYIKLQDEIEKFICNQKVSENWLEMTYDPAEGSGDDFVHWKPLHIAAWAGLANVAKRLLAKGYDWQDRMPNGDTSLHFALLWPRLEMIDVLLNAGADPNFQDHDTHPVICECFDYDDTDKNIVERLLNAPIHKAKADLKSGYGGTSVLHWYAASSDEVDILQLLLHNPNDPENVASINVRDDEMETPLHKLLRRTAIPKDMLQAFIDAGADVNAEDSSSEQPLYEAASYGDSKAVEILLPKVKDIDHQNEFGTTALMSAARGGHRATCEALIKAGSDPTVEDHHSRTALFLACWARPSIYSAETAQGLLDALVSRNDDVQTINKQTSTNRTPLREACGRGYESVVNSILEIIGDNPDIINLQDTRKGQTALHRAARAGHVEIVKSLVAKGADISLRDWSYKLGTENATMDKKVEAEDEPDDDENSGEKPGEDSDGDSDGDSEDGSDGESREKKDQELKQRNGTTNGDGQSATASVQQDEAQKKESETPHKEGEHSDEKEIPQNEKKDADEHKGETALDLAVARWEITGSASFETIILTLLEHVSETSSSTERLMSVAAVIGSIPVLQKLRHLDADFTKEDKFGWSPFQLANVWDNLDAAEFIECEIPGYNWPEKMVKPRSQSSVKLSDNGLQISSEEKNSGFCLFADKPLPLGLGGDVTFYAEIAIHDREKGDSSDGQVAVGFCTLNSPKLKWPGHAVLGTQMYSFSYNSSGSLLVSESKANEQRDSFGPGDKVGLAYSFKNKNVFFTLNGKDVENYKASTRGRLWPVIAVKSKVSLTVDFYATAPWDSDSEKGDDEEAEKKGVDDQEVVKKGEDEEQVVKQEGDEQEIKKEDE